MDLKKLEKKEDKDVCNRARGDVLKAGQHTKPPWITIQGFPATGLSFSNISQENSNPCMVSISSGFTSPLGSQGGEDLPYINSSEQTTGPG